MAANADAVNSSAARRLNRLCPTAQELRRARLQALRKYLTDRGVDPRHIFVESRVDPKLTEARLDVQLIGRPAND